MPTGIAFVNEHKQVSRIAFMLNSLCGGIADLDPYYFHFCASIACSILSALQTWIIFFNILSALQTWIINLTVSLLFALRICIAGWRRTYLLWTTMWLLITRLR